MGELDFGPLHPTEGLQSSLDDDSASDVSMSAESSDGEESMAFAAPIEVTSNASTDFRNVEDVSAETGGRMSRKRKSLETNRSTSLLAEPAKKLKLSSTESTELPKTTACPAPRSELPAEIWHYIFTFVPPNTLRSLLQVNRRFNAFLDPSVTHDGHYPAPVSHSPAALLPPEVIWQIARRRLKSKMPAPILGYSELGMWRLIGAKKCQFCGKTARKRSPAGHLQGPGVEGVEIVWSFAVRSCGPCLKSNSVKEIDLLLSPSVPSVLLPALPFALITPDLQVFTPSMLESGRLSGELHLTKIFLTRQVEDLKAEFSSVKALGLGATEEWLKGLEDRGKQSRLGSTRWENWDAGSRLIHKTPAADGSLDRDTSEDELSQDLSQERPAKVSRDVSAPTTTASSNTPQPNLQPIMSLPFQDHEPFSKLPFVAHEPQHAHQQRTRTREQVLEMKVARRAEIERRAMTLDPPLPSHLLAYIPSFQAALQIITPLDDNAWDLLRPRLLAQRADAEKHELRDRATTFTARVSQERPTERVSIEPASREGKELTDKEWDDAQAPLRARISMHADKIIRDQWNDGNKVDKENSPVFAASVLLEVRRRFYTEVSEAAATTRSAGREPVRDPPQGPYKQKLTLENMRWLFEVKVKPHTESYRKELFLCNGCDDNLKAYGLEGVIQHYAAKHCTSMSLGSIVVYWRSEWPVIPPFHPHPLSKTLRSRVPPASASIQAASSSYRYDQQLPFLGRALDTGLSAGFAGAHAQQMHYGAMGPNSTTSYCSTPYNATVTQLPLPYHAFPNIQPSVQQAAPQPPQGVGGVLTGFGPAGNRGNHYPAYYNHGHFGPPAPQMGHDFAKVKNQMEQLALDSREVWMSLTGLKELPGNLKVYVVLHHLAKRYRSRFSESPPLAMFIDGLSNNKEMRPVRNVNSLQCKACHLSQKVISQVAGEKSTFSLPQLVNHFQQRHFEPSSVMGRPPVDWTMDMVFVPDLSSLSTLKTMTGMDSHKYGLITEAFPQISTLASMVTTSASANAQNGSNASIPDPCIGEKLTYNTASTLVSAPEMGVSHNFGANHTSHQFVLDSGRHQLVGTLARDVQHEPSPLASLRGPPEDECGVSSRTSSGKTSPDSWQTKRHGPRTATAGRQSASRKSRKSAAKQAIGPGSASGGYAQDEMDTVAEEEAKRQEEAIRAMWAADRRSAAHLASVPTIPGDAQRTSNHRVPGTPTSSSPRTPRTIDPVSVSQPVAGSDQEQPPPIEVPDGEVDLFAGLELHLNQQHALATTSARPDNMRREDKRGPHYEMPAVADAREPVPAYTPISSGHDDARDYSRSLQYSSRDYGNPHPEVHIVADPDSGSVTRSAATISTQYPSGLDRDGSRSRSWAMEEQHVEAYELVLVRDAHGDEYYIKRSIRRGAGPVNDQYEDQREPARKETRGHGSRYDESQDRRETSASQQATYDLAERPDTTTYRLLHDSGYRPHTARDDEYDPRFPAGPSRLGPAHHARYW